MHTNNKNIDKILQKIPQKRVKIVKNKCKNCKNFRSSVSKPIKRGKREGGKKSQKRKKEATTNKKLIKELKA